ncbi:zinc-ribbon domain-containing protein [Clostridium sp. MCC353]|uniref:zinc-ribbon domain-containing protein n=1 Tax=Clostridium sp. MCC353 TaxID=2592646 RepID=UPI001C01CF5E|nr:zinc ribbon domain-containing protein [Clostridium sp. MCC353]MBT9777508.1 zinc-ribbon domain-containing protein [Clostridium sp. MCC353]
MICPNCGTELSNDMRFCNQCGSPIRPNAKKKKGKYIFLLVLCLVTAGAGAFGYYTRYVKPVQKSQESFDQAHMYEIQC